MKELRCKCNDAKDPFQFHYLPNKNKITILTTDLSLSLFLGKHSMASASCPSFRPFLQAWLKCTALFVPSYAMKYDESTFLRKVVVRVSSPWFRSECSTITHYHIFVNLPQSVLRFLYSCSVLEICRNFSSSPQYHTHIMAEGGSDKDNALEVSIPNRQRTWLLTGKTRIVIPLRLWLWAMLSSVIYCSLLR